MYTGYLGKMDFWKSRAEFIQRSWSDLPLYIPREVLTPWLRSL